MTIDYDARVSMIIKIFMFGKFLGSVVRIVNAPIRATENLLGAEDEEDRIISKPADILAEELEEIDED